MIEIYAVGGQNVKNQTFIDLKGSRKMTDQDNIIFDFCVRFSIVNSYKSLHSSLSIHFPMSYFLYFSY